MLKRTKQGLKNAPVLGSIILRCLQWRQKKRATHPSSGKKFYDPEASENAGYQSYFIENRDNIYCGKVPDRYERVASATPGLKVLEMGSADGTQSLVLAREKEAVCGVELMEMQYHTALDLKQRWLQNGIVINNCNFIHGGIQEFKSALDAYDTVLMSRVLYHLRSDIDDVMVAITQSNVSNIVLVGCPERARRFREGGSHGDELGKYAKFATKEGMEEVLGKYGFLITKSTPDDTPLDPIVVGQRSSSAK